MIGWRSVLGAIAWLIAPWIPLGAPPGVGSLEHMFAATPLIVVPVALDVLAVHGGRPPALVAAQRAQPVAALLLLASWSLGTGILAGALVLPWLFVALATAIAAALRRTTTARTSLLAIAVFFPAGAVWLLLSRLGIEPSGLTPTKVLLAAAHFHLSGFALQTLLAATHARVGELERRWRVAHHLATVVATTALPVIAAGNASASPVIKAVGVGGMVVATLCLVAVIAVLGWGARRSRAGALLLTSAACGAVGMVLAGVYALGETRGLLALPTMVATHGVLNGFGFMLCGLLAFTARGTRT